MSNTAAQASVQLRFLVADDTGVNRRVAALQLEHQGHFVRTVADGQEALEILEREQFDCVLMDVQMPGIDGLEATRRIRQREHLTGGHLPVLAMTADTLDEDRMRYRAAGMDDVVVKPLDPREAVETARQVIETFQARAL